METDHKLILNHITFGEHIVNRANPKKFEEYKQMAFLFLNRKGKYLFEEDILQDYREGMTLEKLFDQEQDRFVPGANHKKDGKNHKTWYDLWANEEIKREDDFFDYFFACKLRQIGLLEIDSFLVYHLDHSFNNNTKEYFRFLNLMLRKHHEQILNLSIVETVKEWIKLSESETETKKLSGTEKDAKSKGKIKREREDKVTKLNQEQTALLIYCLRETKIILKDEYLNNKEAGQAFSILTGYSGETIRQNLSKSEQARIATKKNIQVLTQSLKDLLKFIENEMEPE
jgi:hypothetical protein